ncbi:MAG: glutamyl-tRNA reductase [Armatimonadota bacterium]
MHIALVGVNHKTAPIELRERVSFSREMLPDALASLMATGCFNECLILSTCNRTEIYTCSDKSDYYQVMISFICDFCELPPLELMPHIYQFSGHKVIEHLFRVATGIDSMVVGETQILGQVKDSYRAASQYHYTGTVLNTLFQQTATVGKRAHTETNIGKGSFSVGSAAVRLGQSIFENLTNRSILIVGAGKMARNTMLNMVSAGANKVTVANRTIEKAAELAEEVGGNPIGLDDISTALQSADIVITSTGMPGFVITRQMIESVARKRRGLPMFIIDIAVPRDVEASVGKLEDVFLYNIDDLQAVVASDNTERLSEVDRVESIIEEELAQFMNWFRTLDAVPVITAFRGKLETIRQTEVDNLSRKLPHLSQGDIEAINTATRSIVNRISHQPMLRIKDYAVTGSSEKLDVMCDAFGLCLDDKSETAPCDNRSDKGKSVPDGKRDKTNAGCDRQ